MKKDLELSVFLAISIILSIIESFIPVINGSFFGIKIGLANIIFIYVLYKYSFKDALLVSVLRVFIIGMLRTGLFNSIFLFSIVGAITSLCVMNIVKKINIFSIIGVSIIGSITHIFSQFICAFFFISGFNFINYLPLLIIISTFSGVITGFISKEIIEKV